jgi:hypothetical protein
MAKIFADINKAWLAMGNKPAMVSSNWCVDWKSKHPGNCEGCPQEKNCHDYVAMLAEIATGKKGEY